MKKTILLICAIWLSACSLIQPKPQVVEVKVPVIAPCVKEVPERPTFITDAELYKLPASEFVSALHRDRLMRDVYEAKLETAMAGCI